MDVQECQHICFISPRLGNGTLYVMRGRLFAVGLCLLWTAATWYLVAGVQADPSMRPSTRTHPPPLLSRAHSRLNQRYLSPQINSALAGANARDSRVSQKGEGMRVGPKAEGVGVSFQSCWFHFVLAGIGVAAAWRHQHTPPTLLCCCCTGPALGSILADPLVAGIRSVS